MTQHLAITQTGPVAHITLTMPEIRNAFSDEVIQAITGAFADVGTRADVRAVVLAASVAPSTLAPLREPPPLACCHSMQNRCNDCWRLCLMAGRI